MPIYTDYRHVNSTVVDAAAINDSIKNILLTRRGSLPGKPTFGARIDEVLFNQLDHVTIGILQTLIKEALAKWEPRISVNNVDVIDVPEFNRVVATIHYNYVDKELNINEQIAISLTH